MNWGVVWTAPQPLNLCGGSGSIVKHLPLESGGTGFDCQLFTPCSHNIQFIFTNDYYFYDLIQFPGEVNHMST